MYTRFVLFIVVIVLVFALVTYLLHRFLGKIKLVKYIPAIWSLFIAVYNVYLSRTVRNEFEDLANVIFAMMFFSGFLSGLITALILDFKKKRISNEDEFEGE